MILESVPTDEISPVLLQEIQDFLDSQDTGHPFQFPEWAGPGSRVMLIRKEGEIRWLGTFGVQRPLGRAFPWLRALTANRGPVCDDHRLWATAAEELAEYIREESFAYLDVLPEWIRKADGDHPNFANDVKWHSIGQPRASLRLDLKAAEEQIFANFRKTTRYEVRRAERLGILSSHNPRSLFLDWRWDRDRLRRLANKVAGSGGVLFDLTLAGLTCGRVMLSVGRSVAKAIPRARRRLPTAAFWRGEGYILDPSHGGLMYYCAIPVRVVAEFTRVGFRLLQELPEDYPGKGYQYSSRWYYYAFSKD